MAALEILLAILALFGHTALWVGVFNRVHALPLACRTINLAEKGVYAALAGLPLLVLWAWAEKAFSLLDPVGAGAYWPLWGYAALCWAIALGPGLFWLFRPMNVNPRDVLLSNHSEHLDAAAELPGPLLRTSATRLLGGIPGNQILKLEVNEKTLRLPGLPASLEGLAIVHLSDLHFTGHIAREYFEFVIEQANRLDGELVAVTGDIVDKGACVAWIPETLGRLRSRHGVFGVLGNHDKRIRDIESLRRTLLESGVAMLGGRWTEQTIRGVRVVLAGNELPWFGPAPNLRDAPPPEDAFRILLAHTPDQFPFAQEHNFPLMLAGHNHGGQIRFPLLGPIVAPSRYGVKYAGGVYQESPTVIHVSRGAGGLHPLRFNCPPEVTKLVLTRP